MVSTSTPCCAETHTSLPKPNKYISVFRLTLPTLILSAYPTVFPTLHQHRLVVQISLNKPLRQNNEKGTNKKCVYMSMHQYIL